MRTHVQPTLYALWRSFTQCTFIEPDGDVVFFKNQQGEAVRQYAESKGSDAAEQAENEGEDEAYKLAGFSG